LEATRVHIIQNEVVLTIFTIVEQMVGKLVYYEVTDVENKLVKEKEVVDQ